MAGAGLVPRVLQRVEGAGARASAAWGEDGQTRPCIQLPLCTGHTGCLASWLFLSEAQAGLPTGQGGPLGYEIIGQLICHLWVFLGPRGHSRYGDREGSLQEAGEERDESEPGPCTTNHSLTSILLFVFFSLVLKTLGRTVGTSRHVIC